MKPLSMTRVYENTAMEYGSGRMGVAHTRVDRDSQTRRDRARSKAGYEPDTDTVALTKREIERDRRAAEFRASMGWGPR